MNKFVQYNDHWSTSHAALCYFLYVMRCVMKSPCAVPCYHLLAPRASMWVRKELLTCILSLIACSEWEGWTLLHYGLHCFGIHMLNIDFCLPTAWYLLSEMVLECLSIKSCVLTDWRVTVRCCEMYWVQHHVKVSSLVTYLADISGLCFEIADVITDIFHGFSHFPQVYSAFV